MLRWSLALFICLATTVSAAENAPHPLTNLPPPGQITTAYFFPDFPNKKFPAGEPVKVVLGIHNDAPEGYNITAILGSINSVTDFKLYVQNFTNQIYMQVVEPGNELTVEYTFQTWPQVPARDFIVALTVFYARPSGEYLSTTFFNQTVDVIEKKHFIDFDLIIMYLILAGIALGFAWLFLPYVPTFGVGKKSAKKAGASGSRAAPQSSEEKAAEDDEWIRGTPYDTFRRRKNAAGEKSEGTTKKAAARK